MRYGILHRALLMAALLAAACSSRPPSLMLVIDGEASVRARTTRIELDVRGAEGSQAFGQSYDLTMRGWPIRKSFVPRNGDLSRFIEATVSAFEAGSTTPLLVSRIRSGFANGQNEVRVLLLDGCIGQPCTEGNTCVVENGSPRCVPTPEVLPVRDAAVVDANSVEANINDASLSDASIRDTSTTSDGCMPTCIGRTCGIESACNTSCGSCAAPQTCNAAGRCETVSSNGPRFIDPPTIAEPQPIAAGAAFNLNMTVTDPQGVDTIVQAEVRNPTGAPGTAGRYQTLERRPSTGEYSATIPWSAFSASNGGVPEDVSGNTTRVLRTRFVDQDGNELVQDISVRLGGCLGALCAGTCPVGCAVPGAVRTCVADRCQVCAPDSTPTTCAPVWQRITTTDAPAAVYAMVYDTHEHRVVLLGDAATNTTPRPNATWTFSGTTWQQLSTAHTPPTGGAYSMVYSVHDRRVVFFNRRDTWVFDGNDWQQVQTAHSPPLRSGHAMVYDAANQRVILFGGNGEYYYRNGNQITERDDTWAFVGGDWQQIVTAHAPSPRWGHAMAYDVANHRVILFGGKGNTDQNDTWIFIGDDWEEVADATPPSDRYNHALAYDTRNHRIVFFAGEDGFGRQYDDTWTFINNTWRRIAAATSPPSRYRHAMVYDSDQQRFVLFGGTRDSIVYSDTWTLRL